MTKQCTVSISKCQTAAQNSSCVSLVYTDPRLAQVLPAAMPIKSVDTNNRHGHANETIENSSEHTINPS